MATLLSGLLGVLMATNQAAAASNLVHQTTGATVEVVDVNDPVEREYLRLLEKDNAVQAEVDQWIIDNDKFAREGAAIEQATLRAKINQRLGPVEKGYQDFLARNPKHVRARLAYGSFLNDTGREEDAKEQWEKARELDPKNPATWNNLANHYGHNGPVTKAFEYYEKAIALATNEPVYLQNFATTVYLFRRDATNYFGITEQQVFDKAMGLYRQALSLDPANFPLATDLAQTYYGIKPPRIEDALAAWRDALKIARDDIEREGVRLHLARWHRTAGDIEAARRELNLITNAMYARTKSTILTGLEKAAGTNAPAPAGQPPSTAPPKAAE